MTSRAGKVNRGLQGQQQPSPFEQLTTDWMDAIAAPPALAHAPG